MAFNSDVSVAFLREVFDGGTNSSHDEFTAVCPICKLAKSDAYNKRKLAIRVADHVTHCWVCGFRARTCYSLIKTYYPAYKAEYTRLFLATDENLLFSQTNTQEPEQTISEVAKLPSGFRLLATQDPRDYRQIRQYLSARGIGAEKDLWKWKFGVVEWDEDDIETSRRYYGRVVVPSFDENGKINYFTARMCLSGKTTQKYVNPHCDRDKIVFNELNLDWSKKLYLVEGVFDMFNMPQNTTCILGSEMSDSHALFQKIAQNNTHVCLALDKDAMKKSIKIATVLYEHGVRVSLVTMPDNNQDLGDMLPSEVGELLRTKTVSFDSNMRARLKLSMLKETTKRPGKLLNA